MDTGSYVVQAGLKSIMYVSMTLIHNAPAFASQDVGLQVCSTPFVSMWWLGLNPWLHAYKASALHTDPQPCFFTP